MAAASAGEVSGPVATMTLSQSAGGRPATSPRSMVISGCSSSARVTVGREIVAVDGQRAAGRQLVRVARAHDQRAGAAHLLVQQADGVGLGVVGAEGVGAHQLGQPVGLVRLGHALRAASRAAPRARPRRAICHAASLPARPPPMMWMGVWGMGRRVEESCRSLNRGWQMWIVSPSDPRHPRDAAPSSGPLRQCLQTRKIQTTTAALGNGGECQVQP